MSAEGAADFARRFEEYWRAPSPEGLGAVLAEDVVLFAPMTPTTRTLADGQRTFAGLLELIPDMTATVHSWGATEQGVLIEFTVSGTAGGKPISWNAVDHFHLGEDGLATRRVSYFDPAPIIRAVATRPRVWPGFLKMRLGRGRD